MRREVMLMNDYPSFGDDWRKRWVQINSSTLHRVASTVEVPPEQLEELRRRVPLADEWDVDGLCPRGIQGTTACGRSGRLDMPGIMSRMGAPRCKQCCRKVGIPAGDGAPYNDKTLTEEQRER